MILNSVQRFEKGFSRDCSGLNEEMQKREYNRPMLPSSLEARSSTLQVVEGIRKVLSRKLQHVEKFRVVTFTIGNWIFHLAHPPSLTTRRLGSEVRNSRIWVKFLVSRIGRHVFWFNSKNGEPTHTQRKALKLRGLGLTVTD